MSRLILIFKKIFFFLFRKKKEEKLSLEKILFIIDEVISLKEGAGDYLLKSAELDFPLESREYREDIEKFLQEYSTSFEYRIEENEKSMVLFLTRKDDTGQKK